MHVIYLKSLFSFNGDIEVFNRDVCQAVWQAKTKNHCNLSQCTSKHMP